MVKVYHLLVLLGCAFAAPRYGDDGGYAGYASYKPGNISRLLKKLGTRANRVEAPSSDGKDYGNRLQDNDGAGVPSHDIGPPQNVHHDLSPPEDDYPAVSKSYDALRPKYRPRPSYGGHRGNELYNSPSSPYGHTSQYGNRDGGYKMADSFSPAYDGKKQVYNNDYPDSPQPYEYGYQVKDEHGNEQFKKEIGDGQGKVQGSYGFRDEYGIYRQVDYVADKGGFRANIRTNEPGTKNQNPADVHIDSAEANY